MECARPSTRTDRSLAFTPLRHALADPCTTMVCDAHASCVKEVGQLATCVCNWGFAMTPDQGCVDTCTLKACVDGTCSKDSVTGAAACSCDAEAGFKLQLDGRTCKGTWKAGRARVRAEYAASCCDVCIIEGCEVKDANSKCVRNLDVAHCECKTTFQLFQGVCTDTCVVKACDGACTHDADGAASCHCDADAGLVLLEDGRTCKDVCVIKDCEGSDANSTCVKNGIVATCICKTGFEMFEGKCTDTCEVKACVDGTCSKDVKGTASCHCDADAGLVLLEDGRACKDVCIIKDCEGSDANSTCVKKGIDATCVCKTGFQLFDGKCTDTCEVKACVDGTCTKDVDGAASCHCDADAGLVLLDDMRTCKDVCVVEDCEGKDASSMCVRNRDVAHCECVIKYELFEGKCTDTCKVKACVNGLCRQNSITGAASCHCDADAGFVLLEDDRTCKVVSYFQNFVVFILHLCFTLRADVCIIKDCEGSDANSTCVKNGIVATCVCKTGFKLFEGKCIGMLALPATTPLLPAQGLPLDVREEAGRDSLLHLQQGGPADHQGLRCLSLAYSSTCSSPPSSGKVPSA
ncbi:unnamed protein product [Closterium sp. Naga37s-1]|nr:unnamed protein product [Closterium sp. Naga37s-1]